MRSFPPLPDVRDSRAPDALLSGHLWLLELIDGTGLRFRMEASGLLRFGDPETTYGDPGAAPVALRPAVRDVRERFDRDALRDAVDTPEGVTFFGVATHHRGTDYDWDRLPPFLGTDVWIGTHEGSESEARAGAFRPPDAAAAIFEGVGLDPVNAIEREVNGRDFDPEAYAVPQSAWRDGPAAGVVVRNKRGGRGVIRAADGPTDTGAEAPAVDDPEAIAATYVTDDRFERVVEALDRRGEEPTVDAVADRIVEAIARETPVRFAGGGGSADPARVRTAVIERTRRRLDDR
ncbi:MULTISPECIES: hypothetical protein [Halorubrum]|uniref:RNA ligase domain-containing protein n=1 Tax=Halorubrum persicum TaxID=1383844 RepID=A0A2G1WFV9_9EURY|nr:hypothetical protein [Halorubrum persicum]PHQ37840.1 hypothetical protein DJ69_15010 [Halorubrum persicum]